MLTAEELVAYELDRKARRERKSARRKVVRHARELERQRAAARALERAQRPVELPVDPARRRVLVLARRRRRIGQVFYSRRELKAMRSYDPFKPHRRVELVPAPLPPGPQTPSLRERERRRRLRAARRARMQRRGW